MKNLITKYRRWRQKEANSTSGLTGKSVSQKIFFLLIVAFFCLMLINNGLVFRRSVDRIKQERQQANVLMLQKTNDIALIIFEQIEQAADQLAAADEIRHTMLIPIYADSSRSMRVVSSLNALVESNNYVDSVYLYIPYDDSVYTSRKEIYSLDRFYDKVWIMQYNPDLNQQKNYGVREVVRGHGDVAMQLTFYKDYPAGYNGRMGQLIVNIDMDQLYGILAQDIGIDEQNLIVVDDEDIIILSASKELIGTRYDTSLLDKNGIYHMKESKSGWQYILPANPAAERQQIKEEMITILLTSVIYFIIALLCTIALTRTIYKPIRKLTDLALSYYYKNQKKIKSISINRNEYEFIESVYADVIDQSQNITEVLEHMRPSVMKETLRGLLINSDMAVPEDNSARVIFGELAHKRVCVCIVEIDQYRKLVMQHDNEYLINEKRRLLELLNREAGQVKLASVLLNEKSMAVVIPIDDMIFDEESEEFIGDIISTLKTHISHELPFTVTVAVGLVVKGLGDLKLSCQHALMMLEYKFYLGENSVLNSLELPLLPDRAAELVTGKLGRITENYVSQIGSCLEEGITDQIKSVLDRFFADMKKAGAFTKPMFLSNFHTVLRQVTLIGAKYHLNLDELGVGFDSMKEELDIYPTIEEVETWFLVTCLKVEDAIKKATGKKQNKYVQPIQEYVQQNYVNHDLSLDVIAGYIGINAAYLSKVFKEGFGENFVDYLNQVRIDEAKKMLQAGNMTVKDIGFAVGFNTVQNFMRVFKKQTGSSPGQFRDGGS